MGPPTHARDGNTAKASGQDGGMLNNPSGSVFVAQVLSGFTGNPRGKGSLSEESHGQSLDV